MERSNPQETVRLYNSTSVATPSRLIKKENPRWTPVLVLTGIASLVGASIPCGYNISVINSPAKFMKAWCNETIYESYDRVLSPKDLEYFWSVVVSVFLVGGAVGSLGGAWLSNAIGRKKSFLSCCILYILGCALFQTCRSFNSVELLILGRLLVGLAAGITTSVVPMYCAEVAPINLRGTLSVLVSMGVTSGVVIGQVMSLEQIFGSEHRWPFALSCPALLVLPCLVVYHWLPESPKYLLFILQNYNKTELEIVRLRGDKEQVKEEIEAMNVERNSNSNEKRSFWSVLKDPKLTLPLVLTCSLQGGQQLSGINAVFYYSVALFESFGLGKQGAQFANLGIGVVNLIVATFSPVLMKKVDRRPLALWSIGPSAFFLFLIMFIILTMESTFWLKYSCVAAIFGYVIFYQLGLGPLPYFIATELFEVSTRPVGMALGSLSSWTFNFFVGILFPTLEYQLGAYVFLIFGSNCVLLTLLVYFYLPETRSRDPSEIAPIISNGFKSRVR